MEQLWTNIITSGATIGALISSLVALFTLREMRAQRVHSYKPEIAIPEVCFNYTNEFPNYIRIWTTDDKEPLKLKIHNIGRGVAKNIKFEWEYDIVKMIERFYLLRTSEGHEINLDISGDRLTYTESGVIKSGGGITSDNTSLDFMLAAETNIEGHLLDLPMTYITISTSIYKYSDPRKIFNLENYNEGLEPLHLKISYEDIGGAIMTKSYDIDIKFFLKSLNRYNPSNNKINTLRGRIYVNHN